MDSTLTRPPLRLAGVGLLAVGLAVGLFLAAVGPTGGSLVGPGVLAVAFTLAAFTGLAKTSSA